MEAENSLRSSRRHFLAQQSIAGGFLMLAGAVDRSASALPPKPNLEPPQWDLLLDVHAGRPQPHRSF
jgi:hypothetical protein